MIRQLVASFELGKTHGRTVCESTFPKCSLLKETTTSCQAANNRLCPVIGIGCAVCRYVLPELCNHSCTLTDVLCFTSTLGCTTNRAALSAQTDLRIQDENLKCLPQTYCLAGADHSRPRSGRFAFRDHSKWDRIRNQVSATASVFKQVFKSIKNDLRFVFVRHFIWLIISALVGCIKKLRSLYEVQLLETFSIQQLDLH